MLLEAGVPRERITVLASDGANPAPDVAGRVPDPRRFGTLRVRDPALARRAGHLREHAPARLRAPARHACERDPLVRGRARPPRRRAAPCSSTSRTTAARSARSARQPHRALGPEGGAVGVAARRRARAARAGRARGAADVPVLLGRVLARAVEPRGGGRLPSGAVCATSRRPRIAPPTAVTRRPPAAIGSGTPSRCSWRSRRTGASRPRTSRRCCAIGARRAPRTSDVFLADLLGAVARRTDVSPAPTSPSAGWPRARRGQGGAERDLRLAERVARAFASRHRARWPSSRPP